jgi:hypothetical protein
LGFDSSDASLSGEMTQGSDATAGMGSYFYVPTGNGRNYYIPPSAIAAFNFNLPVTDNYVIWARVKSSTSDNQTHYIYNGQGKWWVRSTGIHTAWTWVKITDGGTDAIFSFSSGQNSIEMGWYDENAQVDQIMITNDMSYTPTDNPLTTNEFAVYPNPVVSNTFSIQYTSTVVQQAQVALYNSVSTLVKQVTIDLAAGTNEVPVDISDMLNGIYILAFQPVASGENITTRIMISK